MADEFVKAVEDGVRLSKRIYFGKDRSVTPPKPMAAMDKSPESLLPTALMVYAVIPDPVVVDNPDIPSYQPHVHGSCDPPALIPLQMNGIEVEVDCVLDTALVKMSGSWRVHCVMGSRKCQCRVAIPMGEQGSILGVEVEVPEKSYSSKVVAMDGNDMEKVPKYEDGGFLKPHIFIFTIPEVDGGSNISITVRWSQKLSYQDGEFTLTIPYSFPEFVTPVGKKMSKKEKIQLNVSAGPGTEVLCNTISHPLKELRRHGEKLSFLYDTEVLTWSNNDFVVTYGVSSSLSGSVILQSPMKFDIDQREMFCLCLFAGSKQNKKVFRKEVLFVVDISESMRGKPLEGTKNALAAALSNLDHGDSFNVIAFNDEIHLFSLSMELATKKAIDKVTEWMSMNLTAQGGTNILLALNQALEMISNTHKCTPVIFLITDGAVENERNICNVMKSNLTNQGSISPRLYTFGIGSFCNHYFLRMLATIGRGCYDAANDADSIEVRMKGFFTRTFSTILANISINNLYNLDLDDLEVYPSSIPDLLLESPLIISGRYRGDFPRTVQLKGVLADMSSFSVDLKVQEAKDIPLDKILAKQQIELYTAQAWRADNIFRGLLKISPTTFKKETILELKNTSKWKKMKPFVKSYLRSTLFLLNQVTDSQILALSLTRLRASIIFFAAFPSLLRRLIKISVHLWATGSGDLSSCSFHVIKDVAAVFSSSCLDTCFTRTYKAYIARCKVVEIADIRHIEFLKNSFIELCSVDVQKSCGMAILSVKQLTKILQQGLRTKNEEAIQSICSWQYVNCIDIWVSFITAYIEDYNLQSLLYTIIQLVTGVAYLFPGPRYFPLRLKCIKWLNSLSCSSGIFIPIASFLLDTLEHNTGKEGGKNVKAINLMSSLKLPKQGLKSRSFQVECVFLVIEMLSVHFAHWSYHISFPDLATIPLIRLRKFCELTNVESLKRAVKRLIDQIEQNVEFVQKKRDEVSYSPNDQQNVDSFLQLEKGSLNSPFTQYYRSVMEKAASRNLHMIQEISFPKRKRLEKGQVSNDVSDEPKGEYEEKIISGSAGTNNSKRKRQRVLKV